MSNLKKTKEILTVPEKISVFVDKKSGVHTIAFPIIFPDGTDGAVLVTRLKKDDWIPGETIKQITVEYYD